MDLNPNNFTPKSPLYWLCGAFALGLILIGLFAIVAPQTASGMFGMPATAAGTLPWVRLAGIRDIALGLIFFAIMALKEGRTAGILILLTLVVPITDATTVFLRTGLGYQVLIHSSSVLFMIFLGVMLLRRR